MKTNHPWKGHTWHNLCTKSKKKVMSMFGNFWLRTAMNTLRVRGRLIILLNISHTVNTNGIVTCWIIEFLYRIKAINTSHIHIIKWWRQIKFLQRRTTGERKSSIQVIDIVHPSSALSCYIVASISHSSHSNIMSMFFTCCKLAEKGSDFFVSNEEMVDVPHW